SHASVRRWPAVALRACDEMTIALSRPHLLQTGRRGRASVGRNSRSALTSNPHSARCTPSAQLPATSCLGASRTPAASARGESRHAGVRETYTGAENNGHFSDGRPPPRLTFGV